MRGLAVLVVALPVTFGASIVAMAADEECFIGDSALCLANPNCHWNGEKRGCYPGPTEYQDACAVHAEQSVCDTDTTLGCEWSADKSKCETKKN